jgi:hypothetical protein
MKGKIETVYRTVCLAVILLLPPARASAQNLFVADSGSGNIDLTPKKWT